MRIATVFAITLVVILLVAASAGARTWYILPNGSGDAPTIQAGIDSAATGDSVVLGAGTYAGIGNREVDFLGKAITVTSESGRDVTIIDCENSGRGFVFQSLEGPSSVLSGVTIWKGNASWMTGDIDGGGIYCGENTSPTISGNAISNSSASYSGGGICCDVGSHPVISGNIINGNTAWSGAQEGYGGGIFCHNSYPTITGNTISENWAFYTGGGIQIEFVGASGPPWPVITGNTISGNDVQYYGGGGILIYNSSPTISGNVISENLCCLGSAILMDHASPMVSSNTISGNSSSTGAIHCDNGSFPSISNTIIVFSFAAGIYCSASNPTLTNCDIYGNAGGNAICGTDGGGNISADPLFCDRDAGNFYLYCTSPCVNNPGYGQIGAFGIGCGPTAVTETTWGRIKVLFR
jgi:parallel beta-helix repeat protein